jgi:carbonic anhydrase
MPFSSRAFAFIAIALSVAACEQRDDQRCECPPEREPSAPKEESVDLHEVLYTLPGLDHGLVQSPVNILSGEAVDGTHRIALHYDHTAPNFILNRGTTIELDFPTGGGSITYDGNDYDLLQLHFHTPSEHLVDGVTFPMAMHIVNQIRSEGPEGSPRYLVIAILFKMGEGNRFFESFLEAIPPRPGASAPLEPGVVYLDELFPECKMPHYYHYRGSLTTPPHTETVDWLVLKHVMEASPEQIQRINKIEGDNARHVQALYGRAIDE